MSEAEAAKAPAKPPRIRDAATMIIVRQHQGEPKVLMGERSSGHVFFPHHYVFPGGRVDRADGYVKPATDLRQDVLERLTQACTERRARALALAAVRETFEEAGLIIGKPHPLPQRAPKGWEDFFATGNAPCLENLSFIYRAVTPPGRPRRFNARFFIVDRRNTYGELGGSGELVDLQWIPIAEALAMPNTPAPTSIALNEVRRLLADGDPWNLPSGHAVPVYLARYGKDVLEYD